MNVTPMVTQPLVTDSEPSGAFCTRRVGRLPHDNQLAKPYGWQFVRAQAIRAHEPPNRTGRSGTTTSVTDLDAVVAFFDGTGVSRDPLAEALYVRGAQLADRDPNRVALRGTK